jgi:nitronate monooxygenase
MGWKYSQAPIVQAPLAGAQDEALAIAVCRAGGLGSLPCAMLGADQVREQVARLRAETDASFNLNFFAHRPPQPDDEALRRWREALAPFYDELGLDRKASAPAALRQPFNDAFCALVEALRPDVVSFHFGLPAPELLQRVQSAGAAIFGCATTVEEAVWLERRGVDAVIAQGAEAGGHRGVFLTDDIARQPGLFALLPQVVSAVRVPVIAAGGIADGRGIAAAFALGASAVQIGTAYLRSPQARISAIFRAALAQARDDSTEVTRLFSGRPARGIANRLMRELGPMNDVAPAFPLASQDLAPLRAAAEARGRCDFSPLWSGQAAALAREEDAGDMTRRLWREAREVVCGLAGRSDLKL